MASLSSLELVREAVAWHPSFKAVSRALEHRPADAAAAGFLLEAYASGNAPPWLAAHLLGRVGALAGYETVRGILLAAPGALAESYAGCALARIRGQQAFPDLVDILRNAPKQASREGAAYGLGSLDSAEAADVVLEAGISRLIRLATAGSIVGDLPFDHAKVIELLASEQQDLARLGSEVVFSLVLRTANEAQIPLRSPSSSCAALSDAVRRALANPKLPMSPRRRDVLSRWVSTSSAES